MNYFKYSLLLSWLFSLCFCEVTEEKKAKLLSNFINYYNLRPNIGLRASDGFLQSVHEIGENTYRIEVSFTAHQNDESKMMKCSAGVEDIDDKGIAIVNNVLDCHELKQEVAEDQNNGLESVEVQAERGPVKLENEVQADTGITSGEQFIAVPRPQSTAPCIGCASFVNPQAQGVQELAAYGIKHLDIHEPTVKHSLDSVIDVERQVQVVNGIRYILKLSINFDSCTETKNDLCFSTKTCKISILVKPWQTLPSGAKYRAIISNNCTEQWLFGDNGEVLPESTENKNDNVDRHTTDDDEIHIKHHEDVQSQPNRDKALTADELKALEEQILPLDKVTDSSSHNTDTALPNNTEALVKNTATRQQYSENSLSPSKSNKQESSNLNDDKKKTIDELLDFFKFSGYKAQSLPQNDETMSRLKRSYDYDLKLLSLTEDYRQVKQSIENAKYIYEMAQAMVDHLNVVDFEIKNRIVKNVVKAEEEEDNEKHFVYIQAQIVIPCDSPNCDPKETQTKICNGVLDSTNKNKPLVMYCFCYPDSKEKDVLENVKEIECDDPVLLRLSKEVLKKMEVESAEPNAMKIKKILSANTRVSSGRMTKISLIIDYMNCSKSVPMILRKKCSSLEYLGSRICEALVHERKWLKERTITYTCTERPMDMIMTKENPNINITIDDPKIEEILQDALQYLELQSSVKNKLQITNVIKISTQILAGFLIKIEFVVGYTNCSNNGLKYQSKKCVLLGNERLRTCRAQVWDRSWIVDGRQMEVMCDEDAKVSEMVQSTRPKKAIFGDISNQDINDPMYKRLADESLQKYLASSGDNGPHRVVDIEEVTTQVVSGSLTRITFLAEPTDNTEGDVLKCNSKIWEQPWLNKKDIEVTCKIESHRSKRQIVGGEVVQNPNDPTYRQLAEESLQKYVASSGDKGPHRVVEIEEVTTQVVSGSLTRITFLAEPTDNTKGDVLKCNSKILEQTWLNKKDIEVTCKVESHRSKRQIVGGKVVQNPNDPTYRQLAEESLQKYVASSGDKGPHRVVEIVEVTTQVVSGSLTRITFLAEPTDNTKGDVLKCNSKILEQTWLNKKDIEVTCKVESHRSKRQIVGGKVVQNPNDPTYRQLAEESLQKYVASSGDKGPHRVVEIEEVTTQVVSGSLTRITFLAEPTDNTKGDVLKCNSKILEQTWLNKKDIEVTCKVESHRSKRQIVGGKVVQNPNDPTYRQLAEESLQKYVASSGDKGPHRVVEIEEVTTQVVSGSLTRITFLAEPTDNTEGDVLKCNSKIWEQPWLNKKDIEVTCKVDSHRSKRQIVGGKVVQNPNDPTYRQLAEESLQKYVASSGDKGPHRVVEIEEVTTQVVSGSLTRITFLAEPTDNTEGDVLKCNSKIWEQTWLNKKNIEVTCKVDSHRSKRQIVGGKVVQNPNDPTYRQLAEESLQKYVASSGDKGPHRVVEIEEVTTQVVSGSLTRITFLAEPTDNTKGDVLKCNSKIWEQTWLNKKNINVSCVINNYNHSLNPGSVEGSRIVEHYHRPKRSALESSFLEQNPNEYLELANDCLQRYLKDNGSNEPHKVGKIIKATKQFFSEIVTRLEFIALPINISKSDNTVYCKAKIWEQPWFPKRKINVKCSRLEDYLDLFDFDEDVTFSGKIAKSQVRDLAMEAVEKYLSLTKSKYVHRITGIYGFYEQFADELIEFSISPTKCLRHNFSKSVENCPFVQPRLNYDCKAKMRKRAGIISDNDMTVTCNEVKIPKSTTKSRAKRQIDADHIDDFDNEIDEDTMYYYAKRAVSQVNTNPNNNNMFKLITVHAFKTTVQMKAIVVKMFIEVAETYCVRYQTDVNIENCEEMEGLNHKLCLARIYPAPGDEMVIRHVHVVCDDDEREFNALTGLHIFELLRLSIEELERKPEIHHKLVHQGEPQLIPTLESKSPLKLNFIIAYTNCSKTVDLDENPYQCFLDSSIPSKSCSSFIWLETATRTIKYINVECNSEIPRQKRSSSKTANVTNDGADIKEMVNAALEKLEIASLHRYKQRVLHINSHSSKITTGRVTTIDFDVAYTSCIKYEWVQNISSCDIIDHLPRRHCIAQIWERLWLHNGRHINVTCEDDETPLEAHIEFESAEMAMQLAKTALKHIEAKYPHPLKQKIVRIFSLEKQIVAGIHYKMKVEVGFTHCLALIEQDNCTLDNERNLNRFCRINVWVRPWTDHPPNFRVQCDFQESATSEHYHRLQAEYLFYNFVATYNPSYVNDHAEFERRFEIFRQNIKKIHELNVHEKGTAIYGVTRFTDLTYKEFRYRYTGLNTNLRSNSELPMKGGDIPDVKLPQSFDWRAFDSVTEVKDQGSCGSGWAFSVTGNIEGQWKMQTGELVALSEQQLLDCDEVNKGCDGGLPENAYRVIEEQGGLEEETNYPYEGERDKCLFNKTLAKVKIHGAINITTNETEMAQWLVQNGPISIGLNANAMQFYLSGISHPWVTYCSPEKIDHAALIVGFGVQEYPAFHKKIPYWIVKNSWGKSWGEEGYYRVHRGDGTCGINRMATSAFIPSM